MRLLPLFLLLFVPTVRAADKINVVTTLPDIAWAAREVGGAHVSVKSLLKGTEDPHYADAVPEFIRLVSNADVVCLVGLELEIGWLPKVLTRAGNAQVQTGGKGYCDLGLSVDTLERPAGRIDRSMGDVHPFGNPHYWLNPLELAKASQQIVLALTRVDPANAAEYKQNREALKNRMEALVAAGKKKLSPLLPKDDAPVVIEFHRQFTYLFNVYGIRSMGSIEEKPGVPPSAGRIAEVASQAKAAKLRVILATDYNPRPTIERVSELSGLPQLVVPSSIQPAGEYKDYVALHEHIVDALAKALVKK